MQFVQQYLDDPHNDPTVLDEKGDVADATIRTMCVAGKHEIFENIRIGHHYQNGMNALQLACFFHQDQVIEMFIQDQRIKTLLLNQTCKFGQTALHIVVMTGGSAKTLETLLNAGANPRLFTWDLFSLSDDSPLTYAVDCNKACLTKLLQYDMSIQQAKKVLRYLIAGCRTIPTVIGNIIHDYAKEEPEELLANLGCLPLYRAISNIFQNRNVKSVKSNYEDIHTLLLYGANPLKRYAAYSKDSHFSILDWARILKIRPKTIALLEAKAYEIQKQEAKEVARAKGLRWLSRRARGIGITEPVVAASAAAASAT